MEKNLAAVAAPEGETKALAEEAILASGLPFDAAQLRQDPGFYKFVNELEDQLQSQTEAISDIYNQYDKYDADEFREDIDEWTRLKLLFSGKQKTAKA